MVTSDYDWSWPATNGEQVERPGLQRQTLPTHLMSNTGASTTEEEDSYSSVAVPPPLPLQPPKSARRQCHPSLNRRRDTSTQGSLSEEKPREAAGDDDCRTSKNEAGPPLEFSSNFTEKEPETAQSYMERMHVYQLKHAYMKSWPGLLRVLGVMELLFGAMVFACICAYIQKDSQWYNVIGGSFPAYGLGNNYYYTGPKTPFVLVMAGLAWIVTVGLLVLGLSLYYRTILLDSGWWPLTEFTMNACLFFLYMAAGIVYVNGFGLGGLCYTMMANSPLYYQLCRVESGQIAATAFLFVNMLLYLVSAGVCLKVWRHELTRREREALTSKRGTVTVIRQRHPFSFKRMSFRTSTSRPPDEEVTKNIPSRSNGADTLNKSIPTGFIPKPLIVPDYVTKYPKIETAEERERYKGVFNDQYAEYRELHNEIHAANRKFGELKALIEKLPHYTETSEEHRRIMKIIEDYKEKRITWRPPLFFLETMPGGPTFVEKKQRCTYLKNKLSYVKQRIQEYDLECNSSGSPFASTMYESRPFGSPPAYSPAQYSPPVAYRPSVGSFEYDVNSPPPGSYYIEDKPQHFYKWSSPPGIIRILEGIVIILCLAIFACVASTLQWQYGYGYGLGIGGGLGGGGYYPGLGGSGYYPGMGGGGYYPGMGGYGYGGTTDPRAATGFMIAMAAISFIVVLAFFIISVSKSHNSRSRKFYLLVLVFSAILGGMELIASIVYIMGVNPTAGSGGSMYYSQIRMVCSQFYSGGGAMMLGNQYLYHYCVVDPQEAVAIVCGFLAALVFCVIAFFAQRVRHKIWKYGKPNIIWDKNFAGEEVGPNVEEWVKTVPAEGNDDTETIQFSDKPANGINAMSAMDYNSQPTTYNMESQADSLYQPTPYPSRNFNSTPSEELSKKPPAGRKKGKMRRRRSEMDESQYETDYTTGAESCDDADEEEWENLYPPITSDPIRQEYKREFDADHQEYKQLCAEMNEVNNQINYLNKRLDVLSEDDPNYQGVAEEYNRLKELKKTSEYQSKRLQSKRLRSKLSYIKRMVNDYDRQRE
ncbi:LOW QUALITY PROTEIN: uncharacterized protein LOC127582721 [Pristis pectinata]|uniref:LOW QUALITY PROTEIN: uncharacterized protein LOC127582721 n=1 Tax=Pristis pectinata TaxID=685728 RepID=UPI00223E6C72|nr:LOW QUALITY PROTEIN: uncharacterized protein LOC127582721 [Pristis pectinata]